MKVDVDFLNPAISGLKQQWQQLPAPVQEVLPYAGMLQMYAPDALCHKQQQQQQQC
jgi:hypothetical protein